MISSQLQKILEEEEEDSEMEEADLWAEKTMKLSVPSEVL